MEQPKAALEQTLADLEQRISGIRRRQEAIGEQNTKAVLIAPLLAALGWNLFNLSEVVREYKNKPQDNPVDYALFVLRSPSLFIEAKDLGTNLDDRKWVSQILGYATVVGVEWAVLTDGDEYRIYNAHAPVDVSEKLFRVVRVSDLAQREYTARTLELLSKANMGESRIDALWKANFVDQHVKTALAELLRGDSKTLLRWIHRLHPKLSYRDIAESVKRADIQIRFPVLGTPQTLARSKPVPPLPQSKPVRRVNVSLSDLIDADLLQAPLHLEHDYKGHHLTARVMTSGVVEYDGQTYSSLSTSAGMARKSIIGSPPGRPYPQTNGWSFWYCRIPDTGELVPIDSIRRQYLSTISQTDG